MLTFVKIADVELPNCAPLLALPSVVVAERCYVAKEYDSTAPWIEGLPKSKARAVLLSGGWAFAKSAMELAGHFGGPCILVNKAYDDSSPDGCSRANSARYQAIQISDEGIVGKPFHLQWTGIDIYDRMAAPWLKSWGFREWDTRVEEPGAETISEKMEREDKLRGRPASTPPTQYTPEGGSNSDDSGPGSEVDELYQADWSLGEWMDCDPQDSGNVQQWSR